MDRGLFIAASGMLAEQVRQDQLANDLANATTPGYKSDRAAQGSFGEMLLAERRTNRTIGELGMGVRITAQTTDLRPADMRGTGEPLDFAIQGEGFFAVRTAEGERFTRNGRFVQMPDGTLVDQLGNPVLGPDRRPVQVRADGTVAAGGPGQLRHRRRAQAGRLPLPGQGGGERHRPRPDGHPRALRRRRRRARWST